MGRKLNAPKYQLWDSEDTTTTTFSNPTSVEQLDHVCYELSYDNTVAATLEVEFSNDDYNDQDKTWSKVDFSQVITLNGSLDTSTNIIFSEMPFKSLRLSLINNTGTGNISAWVSGKTRGA